MRRLFLLSVLCSLVLYVAPLHASDVLSLDDIERGAAIDHTVWDVAAIEAGEPLDAQSVGRIGRGVPKGGGGGGGGGGQLLIANLSNDGCFAGPLTNGVVPTRAGTDGPYPIARRNSDQHYFIIGADGHVLEFVQPTLTTPCPSNLETLTPVSPIKDWGDFPAWDGGTLQWPGEPSGTGGGFVMGAWYDQDRDWICTSWTGTYSVVTQHNSFGCASFGASTLNTVGCWYTSNSDTNMQSTGSNILDIPASFLSTYGLTAGSKAIGDGGTIGTYNAGMSNGPSLVSLPWPPSGNSCSGGVDHDAGAGTTLVHYEVNSIGSTCGYIAPGATSLCIGCWSLASPNSCHANATYTAPTAPYPLKTAHKTYSAAGDTSDWDPYPNVTPTTGYFARGFLKSVIYDDGVKAGYVVPFAMPHGFVNTTVLASPAPTFTATCYLSFYHCLSFSISSTSTGNGTNIQVGDLMWVQTCVIGTDGAGCTDVNQNYLSFMIVDTVNTGTGAITGHINFIDSGDGTTGHVPVVGGHVYLSLVYAHAEPDISRLTGRLMIFPLSQLGEVKTGARQKYDVTYNEDVDWQASGLLPGFGTIIKNHDQDTIGPWKIVPSGVFADPGRHKIIIAINSARHGVGVSSVPVIHVLSVASTP